MNTIVKQYPNFIKVLDSTAINKRKYSYYVNYTFEFSLCDIHSIAWKASKMSNLNNEFSYQCINSFVKVYKLQEIFITRQKKIKLI